MTLNRRNLLKIGGAAAALPLLGSKAFAQTEPLKVGFVLVGTINDNGWNYAHNQGRLYLEEQLGDAVETVYVENVPEGPDCERVLRELAQQGCKLIFATSFGFGDSVIKVAEQFLRRFPGRIVEASILGKASWVARQVEHAGRRDGQANRLALGEAQSAQMQ